MASLACKRPAWKRCALGALLALTLAGSPGCVSTRSGDDDDEEVSFFTAFLMGLIFGDSYDDDDDDWSTACGPSCDPRRDKDKDKDTRHSGRRRP